MTNLSFPYAVLPENLEPPFLGEHIDLQTHYAACHQELGLQQSKRDQLAGYYIGILGAVAALLLASDITAGVRGGICLGLFALGVFWLRVTLRYRICKEVCSLTCLTLTRLFCADRKTISKALVQHTFYRVMEENAGRIPRNAKGKKSLMACFWKSGYSAEYGMFRTLAVFTAGAGGIGLWLLGLPIPYAVTEAFVFLLWQLLDFHAKVLDLYQVTEDHRADSFERVFQMAWQLQFFP